MQVIALIIIMVLIMILITIITRGGLSKVQVTQPPL